MSKTTKKSIALMLVILQLIVLLPTTALNARAAEVDSAVAPAETSAPVLNDVIEGTVRFGSFNYTGDTANNRDGIDYVAPFYYSDDYFSPSAVNPNATGKTMNFSALEDPSMVTLSHAFTVAAFGSSEGTVPVDWSVKSENGEKFLDDCGFENIYVNDEFNQQTGKDTLGYIFGTKEITVWDAASQSNKTFTLVAVGVRGAGYGAEWASNLTIGDSNGNAARDKSYSGTYRHKGFDDGAKKVLADLDTYVAGLSGDVKYWVVGYSRAGAVANLVAGDITKQAAKYKTSRDNVYGYTFEAAAGALTSEEPSSGTYYPNIHNIINPMDAVPRVSPGMFNHCRLGVDYRLPFHGNTSEANNTKYYNNMYAVLPTVASIADIYNRNVTGNEKDNTQDPVITDSDPNTYPYKRTIQIKSFGITNYNNGFVEDVSNSSSKIAPNSGLYLDQFLDKFVDAFLKCIAWDYEYFYITDHWLYSDYMTDKMTKDPMSHEQQYVKNYQEALRTLAYHALKQPGMGLGALDGVMDNAMDAIDFGTIWNGAGIAVHYGEMNTGVRYNRAVYLMIEPMGDIVNKIIDQTGLFQQADLPEVHAAIKTIMPVLTWLYCEDHHNMNGEYLGTVFANVGTILVTHIPEQGISWDMSLDDVFISDYREITIPKATVTNLYEFRAGLDDALSANGRGALVAKLEEGSFTLNKDERITVSESGDDVTIRYPGNLDIRFDVTPVDGTSFADMPVQLTDYSPKNVVNVKSTATRAADGNVSDTDVEYDSMLTPYYTASAQEINALSDSTTIPMSDKDTLHIMARHGRNQVTDTYESTYDISKTVYVNTIVEGQFRQDADGEVYLPYVMDQTGTQFTCAEIRDQVAYTSALYAGTGVTAAQRGSKIDVALPTVANDNKVVKYFTTDASDANNVRLSSDTAPYDAALTETDTATFAFGTSTDRKAVLEQEDCVYHVFYNGDFRYTVTWKNDDGTVLETDENVKYNAAPSYDGETPTKEGEDHTVYTFKGWTPELNPVTGDVIYVAAYDETKQYTVTWQNEDGTVLGTTTVNEGEMPVFAGEVPTKAADAQYTYAFSGWSPELAPATGDAAYTAVFDSTVNTYTVRFLNEDGTELQSATVPYGETPAYTGETPTKAGDAQYSYVFAGWDEDPAPVTGDAVYTAVYTQSVNRYTITWLNEDGSLIDTTEVAYGAVPGHADAEKAPDAYYTYTFAGWTPAVEPVTGNATYTATFNAVSRIHVVFRAPDVQDGNRMIELTGTADSATVQQQPNYPSYMGYDFTGVTVTAGDESETVSAENGTVTNEALNAAIARILAASGSQDVTVTANYRQTEATYTVNLKYKLPGGEIVDNFTTDAKVVGEAMRLTTSAEYHKGADTYYFDHWVVDGKEYKSLSITVRPEKAGSYDAVAVYVEGDSAANEPVLQVVNAYKETQNDIKKIAVTLSYNVPEGCTVQAVGFRVSTKDSTLETTYSTATSKLTTADGSYTLHINVNNKADKNVYVCAYLTYVDGNGETHTILTDPVAYVWNDMNNP